ncbi:A/G-specific adenine glycosylase [Candidatus Saccharibacteria bacterium]|nr:A/G-specific adenine glycosylase [Candidatus Saccharibacteria bacterium]
MDEFTTTISQKGSELYRDMPWRNDTRPYYILVSELMLQQTQVGRVIPKFLAFISVFPDESSLASASLADVLKQWQGLGYNRRAKYLHDSAKRIVSVFNGNFPDNYDDILSLPGVGKNTCGAISAYAFNRPSVFIETNVRTVFIHHFFAGYDAVSDAAIHEILAKTIDGEHPREFYWALMDYGSWLKANGIRNISRSKHYTKQSALVGSVRQMRGSIIKALAVGETTEHQLRRDVNADSRFDRALLGLLSDGLIAQSGDGIHLTK